MPPADPKPFSVEAERRDDVLLVRVQGRVAELEAMELGLELGGRMEGDDPPRRVIVDLADVSFISSSCLGAFLAAHKKGRETGAALVLTGASPLVREIITTTRLNKLFPLFDSVEEALATDPP